MAEAPEAEGVFEIGEFLAELVQIPVPLRVAVDREPGLLDGVGERVAEGAVVALWSMVLTGSAGFSAALSGMTMPPGDFVSASSRWMITRS